MLRKNEEARDARKRDKWQRQGGILFIYFVMVWHFNRDIREGLKSYDLCRETRSKPGREDYKCKDPGETQATAKVSGQLKHREQRARAWRWDPKELGPYHGRSCQAQQGLGVWFTVRWKPSYQSYFFIANINRALHYARPGAKHFIYI